MAGDSFHPLCRAVPIQEARKALGNKARSEIYAAWHSGKLDLVKDGFKTLVTVASIRRYQADMPRAVLKGEPKHLEEGHRKHLERKRARKHKRTRKNRIRKAA